MKKEDLIQLIEHWDAFTQVDRTPTIKGFANWLLKDQTPTTHVSTAEKINTTRQTCYLMSRIERYSRAMVKQLFSDLPLIGYDDFILLNTVYHQPNISKKELYDINIYEMNSGTQVVNRLKREGLLEDFPSEADRRVSLLRVSDLGAKVRDEAFRRLGLHVAEKGTTFEEAEIQQLLGLVSKFEAHHQGLYEGKGTEK